MQTKRDQVQAHMFVMGRLTSAMLRADPDAPESPQGRTNRAVTISVLIGILLCAGSFVFGLLSHGTKSSWRDPGTLVINKETGTRYLYLGGRLRPVRNHTSARLLAGDQMKVMTIGSKSLRGTPHGSPVGISGAPDEPPGNGNLTGDPWQVCSGNTSGATGTTVAVGAKADGAGLKSGQALLVSGPDNDDYLVWQGRRLRLDQKANAAEALGYGSTKPVPVSAAFLNSLPTGPDLAPADVPGRGGQGPALGGLKTRVGQVFKVAAPGGTARYYLLRKEGLAPLTATGAALVLGDPDTRKQAYAGGAVSPASLGADVLSGHLAPDTPEVETGKRQPATPPEPVDLGTGRTPCVGVESGSDGTRVSVALIRDVDLGPTTQAPPEGLVPACVTVNRITVRPGGGALVHVLGAGGGEVGNTLYLVTDTGMKYRLPAADSLKALGYSEGEAQALPSSLLAMLPTGPDLTPQAASEGRSKSSAPRCGTEK
ncbi:type VII secretion protein EccB [Streptomyces sp. NPDC020480]|uniref:type VII secretion protein EccB n=1 Tax=Streptomyces sp. NPDC020480 TaxID=3365076 RepID=UPI0037A67861